MPHRILAPLVAVAALVLSCGGDTAAGGDFDCALWRKRASDAAADVERQRHEIQFVPYKGLADTRRRDANRRLQQAQANAARLNERADRACATLPDR